MQLHIWLKNFHLGFRLSVCVSFKSIQLSVRPASQSSKANIPAFKAIAKHAMIEKNAANLLFFLDSVCLKNEDFPWLLLVLFI